MLSTLSSLEYSELTASLQQYVIDYVIQKYANLAPELVYQLMREVYLYHVDSLWMKHIDEMEYLRDKVGLM